MKIDRYVNDQFIKIGLYIQNNKPVNEYKDDSVRLQLTHVNGKTNHFSLSQSQLEQIHEILSQE